MDQNSTSVKLSLSARYPPSEPCSCETCVSYCKRPGWWTVDEAEKAIHPGLSHRMMLEISPEFNIGVLSPAFKGNETNYALQIFAKQGCTFLHNGLCELFGTGMQPLECRFCHHSRTGEGVECHLDIEKDCNCKQGKQLIVRWGNLTGFWQKQNLLLIER